MNRMPSALVALGMSLLATAAVANTAHRNPPSISNAGGASKPLRLVGIIPSTYPDSAALADFVRALPASDWFAAVQAAYPPPPHGPANLAAQVVIVHDMPEMLHQSRTVVSYQDYVYGVAKSAGIHRDPARQTIYTLFIPCADPHGMDSFGCVSHHPTINAGRHANHHSEADLFTNGDSMAVVLKLATSLDGHTTAASHEITEAYTNTPGVGQWRLHSTHPTDPWMDAPPWVRGTGTIEMADMAEGALWFEADPVSGQTFRYQRIYSTGRSTSGDDDVAVPPQTNPVYGVSTPTGDAPHDWHSYNSPAVISIPVTAWAEPGVGAFTVTASIGSSGGALANPCTLPQTSWTVQDGDVFQLQVDVPHITNPHKHIWCTIELDSARPSPPAGDDLRHFWMTGVIVLGHS